MKIYSFLFIYNNSILFQLRVNLIANLIAIFTLLVHNRVLGSKSKIDVIGQAPAGWFKPLSSRFP